MVNDDSAVIPYSELRELNLKDELLKSGIITFSINDKQAKRIKHDWDKYGAYKTAYAEGNARKGLLLSFTWMMSNIRTSFAYGDLEKITGLYYELAHKILPVQFSDAANGAVFVTFRIKPA
jgi:hypothetical protein